MSAADDAQAILDGVVPLGDDHPAAQALGDAVRDHIAARPPRSPVPQPLTLDQLRALEHASQPLVELRDATAAEASGIARPGDVLVLSYDGAGYHPDQVAELRDQLLARLPGLADVVIVPFRLEAIYRGDTP